ncbi:hypothetical protein [Rhizobium tubonense]|uniref:Uncharacterized protein n=1 Tax=Rhizobium tubonense TaxID=484088 RepID=A0A2W4F585_9HYPH|nr:hypothetical protein [Rhizobium tubonense]PZM16220.1 hypothetical protein CPY51_04345 [Rhizobium tubonense]
MNLKLFRSLRVRLLIGSFGEGASNRDRVKETLMEERPRAKYSKEEKRLQAENATLVAAAEAATAKKARDAKTARLRELRLAKEREDKGNGKREKK